MNKKKKKKHSVWHRTVLEKLVYLFKQISDDYEVTWLANKNAKVNYGLDESEVRWGEVRLHSHSAPQVSTTMVPQLCVVRISKITAALCLWAKEDFASNYLKNGPFYFSRFLTIKTAKSCSR